MAAIRPAEPDARPGGGPRDVELRVRPTADALVTVRTVAGDLAARAEFPLDAVDDLRLAADEVASGLAALARPDTPLTCTFSVTDATVMLTASVSTTGPTTVPRDTFSWLVLTTLADDVAVLSEAPGAAGDPHRLALRVTLHRPADPVPGPRSAEPAGEGAVAGEGSGERTAAVVRHERRGSPRP